MPDPSMPRQGRQAAQRSAQQLAPQDGAVFYLAGTEWGPSLPGAPRAQAPAGAAAHRVGPSRSQLGAGLEALLRSSSQDVAFFVRHVSRLQLRSYQREVAQAVVDSVLQQQGRTFVVMFPRQSGKNELQAQIEAYLLLRLSQSGGEMVKVSPTWQPQSLNARQRLERVLEQNFLTRHLWRAEQGYILRLGRASLTLLSGQPTSHVVGVTASALLECDEAQDVSIAKWDKEIAPMAASTNATRVFWGTAWTQQTLLARELQAAQELERQDGVRRVWSLSAAEVGAEVPAYRVFVAEQVRRLGRDHPLVKTQYFSEPVDAETGLFPAARLARMRGTHPPEHAPRPGRLYALAVDVAGEDEGAADGAGLLGRAAGLRHPGRDSTAATVFEVDLAGLGQDPAQAPAYRVVQRREWVGVKHSQLYGLLKALAEHWGARYVVVDATGVGQGLCSFLEKALPGAPGQPRVLPFLFNVRSKSDLGWKFLAVVETGRYQDYTPEDPAAAAFWRQAALAQGVVQPGLQHLLHWGVPEGTRDSLTGELAHDDWLVSAALCALLDDQKWGLARSGLAPAPDIFQNMQEVY